MNLEEVKAALDEWERHGVISQPQLLIDAARRYVDWQERGERVWRCTKLGWEQRDGCENYSAFIRQVQEARGEIPTGHAAEHPEGCGEQVMIPMEKES